MAAYVTNTKISLFEASSTGMVTEVRCAEIEREQILLRLFRKAKRRNPLAQR